MDGMPVTGITIIPSVIKDVRIARRVNIGVTNIGVHIIYNDLRYIAITNVWAVSHGIADGRTVKSRCIGITALQPCTQITAFVSGTVFNGSSDIVRISDARFVKHSAEVGFGVDPSVSHDL